MPHAGACIAQQISRIPPEDIEKSRNAQYPTVLMIGPNPFLNRAFDEVQALFLHARTKIGTKLEIDLLEGYRRLAADEYSRPGWRIVVAAAPLR